MVPERADPPRSACVGVGPTRWRLFEEGRQRLVQPVELPESAILRGKFTAQVCRRPAYLGFCCTRWEAQELVVVICAFNGPPTFPFPTLPFLPLFSACGVVARAGGS